MLDRVPRRSAVDAAGEAADYEAVRRAIAFITDAWKSQPETEAIADAAGLDVRQLNALFRRWAGLTPKAFLQAVTFDHARRVLAESGNVFDAALDLGLSGPSRLHDLFVSFEAMSPGEWKRGGAGATVWYGVHPSPFGAALVMATERGLCRPRLRRCRRRGGRPCRHAHPLAGRTPRGGCGAHRAAGPAHLRRRGVAAADAAARGADRHRFSDPGVGGAGADSARPGRHLCRCRRGGRPAPGGTCCRRGGGEEPGRLRRALPPGGGRRAARSPAITGA